ncbi:hypothetical protein D3OALGA1CA_4080 [Olavius algarvensis associated proteobacterium Delta 3]|nr:hypothetical protein D3OALGB2SA_993 [Olavius algarvensis associated proteobacterium Delta 3]CAB5144893.1 hypothetical protein D3OALGA1CA_4080 [Olavius algarvensis associated proteobacterium Delta 3]
MFEIKELDFDTMKRNGVQEGKSGLPILDFGLRILDAGCTGWERWSTGVVK